MAQGNPGVIQGNPGSPAGGPGEIIEITPWGPLGPWAPFLKAPRRCRRSPRNSIVFTGNCQQRTRRYALVVVEKLSAQRLLRLRLTTENNGFEGFWCCVLLKGNLGHPCVPLRPAPWVPLGRLGQGHPWVPVGPPLGTPRLCWPLPLGTPGFLCPPWVPLAP